MPLAYFERICAMTRAHVGFIYGEGKANLAAESGLSVVGAAGAGLVRAMVRCRLGVGADGGALSAPPAQALAFATYI